MAASYLKFKELLLAKRQPVAEASDWPCHVIALSNSCPFKDPIHYKGITVQTVVNSLHSDQLPNSEYEWILPCRPKLPDARHTLVITISYTKAGHYAICQPN